MLLSVVLLFDTISLSFLYGIDCVVGGVDVEWLWASSRRRRALSRAATSPPDGLSVSPLFDWSG